MNYFLVGVVITAAAILFWKYRSALLREIDELSREKQATLDRVISLEKTRLEQEELRRNEEIDAIPDITIDDFLPSPPEGGNKDGATDTLPSKPVPVPSERREGRLVPDSGTNWGNIRLRVLSSSRNREGGHLGETGRKVAPADK